MTTKSEHPLTGLLDEVARTGKRPNRQHVDQIASDVLRNGADLTASELKRAIDDAIDGIVPRVSEGHSGEARAVAREGRDYLLAKLGSHEPEREETRTTKEIVDSIPRGI